jgi:hypothetical protein
MRAIWKHTGTSLVVAALAMFSAGCQSDDSSDDNNGGGNNGGGNNGGSNLGGSVLGGLFGGGQNGGGQNGGGDNGGNTGGGDNGGNTGGGDNGGGTGMGGGDGSGNGGGTGNGDGSGNGGGGGGASADACATVCNQLIGCIVSICNVQANADQIAQAAQQECVPQCTQASQQDLANAQAAAANGCAQLQQAASQDSSFCDGVTAGGGGDGGGGGGGGGDGDCQAACEKITSCGAAVNGDVPSLDECVQGCEEGGYQAAAACVTSVNGCDNQAIEQCVASNGGGGMGGGGGTGTCNTAVFCQAIQCGFMCAGDQSCAEGCTMQYCGANAQDCLGCNQQDAASCFGQ